ncbi:MAG: hypothetical protein WBN80_05385 [Prochlorococcaceae cyanobacterium]|jgi:alkylated DNA nucleotide flippase Atl1|uniref:hypothetical protein n=1 Tax=unclassified Synechococcus TaxID=2626047 RepID=UPI000B98600D|nr:MULTISPECIES: hypothetical protein [unclassified Synechococcus]MCP9819033.1 hypothetical protein [Synechococcus sp. Cruz-9H2]MCP9839028.1 hypothetical protein [Synechococcus sp. J7-Johnson]MCP9843537.1 hypothetical protein [Synechococcus sp. Edmonson 11F2]MCP9855081.1 hypothetical protein [Synechococcus sp. Cruz-9C9]MCP9862947.1 hypothetical protein [Synechococcus sp. Cruz-7E5]
MPAPIDRAYATVTGQLATLLGVSIAAARRRVDQQAAREGTRSPDERITIAERMIQEAQGGARAQGQLLDALLVAEDDESGFMVED